ncbi:MAG TPA: hypothetical protein VK796_00860 [Cytophaga sp.]|jgi:hypothetical protein|nr:hypothetical protein [Cytophaga sp.]
MNQGSVKAIFGFVFGIAICVFLQFVVFDNIGQAFSEKVSSYSTTINSVGNNVLLNTMVEQVNKSCPITLDAETRMDGAEVISNDKIQFNYTLTQKEQHEVDAASLQARVQPILLENMKSNASFEVLRTQKITVVFNYKDKNGVSIFKIVITPQQYTN